MPALCIAMVALGLCAPVQKNASMEASGGDAAEKNTKIQRQAEMGNRMWSNLEAIEKMKAQIEDIKYDLTKQQIRLNQMDSIVDALNHNIRRINKMEETVETLNNVRLEMQDSLKIKGRIEGF